jgi:hypothetical protein
MIATIPKESLPILYISLKKARQNIRHLSGFLKQAAKNNK